MNNLPDPNFISRDQQAITTDLIARYESLSGKTLYPGQIESLFINLLAYAKAMTHINIQDACKQDLVHFAQAPMLDYLGELIKVPRLAAAKSKTVLRFSVAAGLVSSVTIPAGTLVDSGDGKITFVTDIDAVLNAGAQSVDVSATCGIAGTAGNGYLAGQVNVLSSDIGSLNVTVANIIASSGGADDESSESYRARLMEGPETLAAAGPHGAYRAHAMAAHQSIIDVGVIGPQLSFNAQTGAITSSNLTPPGAVFIYPLTAGGLPDADILSRVDLALNAENVRPLCDCVQVMPPVAVDYVIHASLTLYDTADAAKVLANAQAAATAYAADRSAGLGRDVVPFQLKQALFMAGVYQLSPVESAVYQVTLTDISLLTLDDRQWACCTDINITIGGVVHG